MDAGAAGKALSSHHQLISDMWGTEWDAGPERSGGCITGATGNDEATQLRSN